MPYENDPVVLAWFEGALADPSSQVRRRAVELLEHVECSRRHEWLMRAERDEAPPVAAAAVLVGAILSHGGVDEPVLELLESDLPDDVLGEDLEWEWEYAIKVCEDRYVPAACHLVWLRAEDDAAAKELALLKASAGLHGRRRVGDVAVIVGKRLVTRYTRSARSSVEAMRWHAEGRPRYSE